MRFPRSSTNFGQDSRQCRFRWACPCTKRMRLPSSGIASVVTTMKDGGSVETGMWAREGLAECMHLAGSDRVPSRCFMQMGGTALRMPFADLTRDVESLEPLRAAIQHSIQTQALVLGQLVACNRLH